MQNSILITGAGTGIGQAIALKIAEHQPETCLILTGRNAATLNETLERLGSTKHKVIPMDITNVESIQALRKNLEKDQTTLSGMILNAGIGGENTYGPQDRWDEIIATNLTGPYVLAQELLPLMKANQSSFKSIIFLSSILGRIGVPHYSAYCASKAGVLGLMRSMAVEHASNKILVNAICPGWVDTEMSRLGIEGIAKGMGLSINETLENQMSYVPLKKMAQPEEVAELVQFLVSKKQTSITGQAFDINNGALMP